MRTVPTTPPMKGQMHYKPRFSSTSLCTKHLYWTCFPILLKTENTNSNKSYRYLISVFPLNIFLGSFSKSNKSCLHTLLLCLMSHLQMNPPVVFFPSNIMLPSASFKHKLPQENHLLQNSASVSQGNFSDCHHNGHRGAFCATESLQQGHLSIWDIVLLILFPSSSHLL